MTLPQQVLEHVVADTGSLEEAISVAIQTDAEVPYIFEAYTDWRKVRRARLAFEGSSVYMLSVTHARSMYDIREVQKLSK